ncbi:MAG TPA: hypothetical protein VFW19_10720 [Allosphingosinicella sp.]|nr:hypothetical protein [Allosphingosinicella sp.]
MAERGLMNLYDKVADALGHGGFPITSAGVREVEHALKIERRVAAYDRSGLPILRAVRP